MTTHEDVMRQARALLALAEQASGAPGTAGLAYQAANMALMVLLVETDGSDPWAHAEHARRASELTVVPADDLLWLHRTRQLDFYGNATYGAPLELPSAEDRARALAIAREVVRRVDELRSSPQRTRS
jgi:HEPN domain-containing protein